MRLTKGSPPDMTPKAFTGAIKPNRLGEPEAGKNQRVTACDELSRADSRIVLMTQSLRSLGAVRQKSRLSFRAKAILHR